MLAGALVVGSVTGCGSEGGKKGGTGATDIEIGYLNTGLGKEWLDALVEAFNEKYPDYNAYVTASASSESVLAEFGMEDIDTVDLYMATRQYDTTYMEPLDDVLNTTIEGESKSIKEKFNQSYLAMEELDGKYYSLTQGGGLVGFVYNKKLFAQAGIEQLPRTSNELALACTTLADQEITPMCHFYKGGFGYYGFIENIWFAQYDGIDYVMDLYKEPTLDKMIRQDGRYKALKAMERIVTPKNILNGSNSSEHITMQTKFLEGECAMMITGSWLSSEMKHMDKTDDFAMMKTPVISSIIEKLSTVKSEADLRKVISAIDKVTNQEEAEETYKQNDAYQIDGLVVSKEDWDCVKTARNMMSPTYSGSSCFIPNYSNAKEGAKAFLKFMYSDEGYKLYTETLHLRMPLNLSEGEIDTSTWNAFEQNQSQILDATQYIVSDYMMSKNSLFINSGAHPFVRSAYEYVNLMSSNNEAERVSADEAWERMLTIIKDRYENEWMMNVK